jgi:indole-3-glycerol phosphate synthase
LSPAALTAANVGEAIAIPAPAGVDVSGGVETAGAKDAAKIYQSRRRPRGPGKGRAMLARIVAGNPPGSRRPQTNRPPRRLQRTYPPPPMPSPPPSAPPPGAHRECKLASPAKGLLTGHHTVAELAAIYTAGGAAALSVHTSAPVRGRVEDLAAVRAVSSLPIMRKDFIIDEYQIYEARWAGADAILLIAAILTDEELARFTALAAHLGLDALVEVHSRAELDRVQRTPAPIIGINNRDLRTLHQPTLAAYTFALLPHTDGTRLVISEKRHRGGDDANASDRRRPRPPRRRRSRHRPRHPRRTRELARARYASPASPTHK